MIKIFNHNRDKSITIKKNKKKVDIKTFLRNIACVVHIDSICTYLLRRSGRVVEGGGLENR